MMMTLKAVKNGKMKFKARKTAFESRTIQTIINSLSAEQLIDDDDD